MKLFVSPFNRKKANSPRYASAATRGTNARPLVSTARRYATNLRATANVARLRDPRVNSRSWTSCSCGFQRGASFAASISTRCKCLCCAVPFEQPNRNVPLRLAGSEGGADIAPECQGVEARRSAPVKPGQRPSPPPLPRIDMQRRRVPATADGAALVRAVTRPCLSEAIAISRLPRNYDGEQLDHRLRADAGVGTLAADHGLEVARNTCRRWMSPRVDCDAKRLRRAIQTVRTTTLNFVDDASWRCAVSSAGDLGRSLGTSTRRSQGVVCD